VISDGRNVYLDRECMRGYITDVWYGTMVVIKAEVSYSLFGTGMVETP